MKTFRRKDVVPDDHPIVTDPKSPLPLGAQAGLLVVLIIGMSAQFIYLRRHAVRAELSAAR